MVKGAKREVHREGLSNVNVLNHAKSIYYIYILEQVFSRTHRTDFLIRIDLVKMKKQQWKM